MENLFIEFQQKLLYTSQNFERYLVKMIDINNRLIVIKGARGVGKVSIATSVPFTPNISKLSEKIGVSRNGLLQAIKILSRASLITELYKDNK